MHECLFLFDIRNVSEQGLVEPELGLIDPGPGNFESKIKRTGTLRWRGYLSQ